jgi:hypothetical protein
MKQAERAEENKLLAEAALVTEEMEARQEAKEEVKKQSGSSK